MSQESKPAGIPRIIHQIWYQGAAAVPDRYRTYAQGWKDKHPTWEYRLWDHAACRALMAERYPAFLPIWDHYPLNIQRIDAIRYFLLNTHGGIYLDMDMECLKPLDPLFEACDFLLSQTIQFNNAAMASSAGHPFWEHVFAGLQATSRRSLPRGLSRHFGGEARYAAETVGPLFFSRMVQESGLDKRPQTRICPGHVFEPNAPTLVDGRPTFSRDMSRSYAIHHEDLGWMPSLHRTLSLITRPIFRLVLTRGR